MTRGEALFFRLAAILAGGSGVVLFVLRYLFSSKDPFAVVNHPWEPAVQHLHVLLAPLLVFAAGLVWRGHVLERLRRGEATSRPSGLGLLLTLVPMIASGYLIQVAVDASWRRAWVWVHLVASGLWLLGYGIHVLARRGLSSCRPSRRGASSRRVPLRASPHRAAGASIDGAP